MNLSAHEESQPAAQRPEGSVLRFLRWLLEPPVAPQTTELRVLRWLLRAVGWIVYAACVGPDDGHGNAGVAPKGHAGDRSSREAEHPRRE